MRKLIIILAVAALSFGCDEETTPVDSGTDSGTPPEDGGTDSGPPDTDAGTDAGMPGDYAFRTDAPSAYTRVDRAGSPAVSTALVSSAMKNAYNDDDPEDDVTGSAPGKWAGEFIASLEALHTAVGMTSGLTLNAQLATLSLTPCADGATCATQTVGAGGPPVYSFIIPDVLTIDTSAAAGFPNGRQLGDPAMDRTLSLVLLDMVAVHNPATLEGVPLNPTANDVAFRSTFPYVAVPHTP